MTSFKSDTGPYLQYTHLRLTSLTRKNRELLPLPPPEQIAAEILAEQPAAREIAFLLGTYPDVVRTRAERGRHVCIPPRARHLERVGDGRSSGQDGRGARTDVALFVCLGRAWGWDAIETDVRWGGVGFVLVPCCFS